MSKPPNVTLARMLLSGLSPEEIVRQADPGTAALAARDPDQLRRLADAARHVDHSATSLAAIRAGFDAAARIAPDAAAAAYTLGDPALARAATAEIVAWLDGNGLLGPGRDVLDLGCGTGRLAAALAPLVRSVLGVDISGQMIAGARHRHPGLRFEVTDGTSLRDKGSPLPLREGGGGGVEPAQNFDLILAADSFPYLVQAAVADRHVADAASLLKPNGALAILNLSYRTPAQDRADAKRWAAAHNFHLKQNGTQPFALWDGRAFLFLKPPG